MMLKRIWFHVFCVSCGLLLLTGTNAKAATIVFTDEGPRYWEVVESAEEIFGMGVVGVGDDDQLIIGEVSSGWRITYDIFNNSTYTINGFMVGVSDALGSGHISGSNSSPSGWSGFLTNRWNHPNDNYWDNELGLADYDYAYKAYVLMGGMDFGEDSSSDGEPLQPFQGITGEFSFVTNNDELASPVILFAEDATGQEITLFAESSHFEGQHRLYVAGAPVPEPTTMLLFGLGLLGVSGISRRRKP